MEKLIFNFKSLDPSSLILSLVLVCLGFLSTLPLYYLSNDLWDGLIYANAIREGNLALLIQRFEKFISPIYVCFYSLIFLVKEISKIDTNLLLKFFSSATVAFSTVSLFWFCSFALRLNKWISFAGAISYSFFPIFTLLSSSSFLHVIFFFHAIFLCLALSCSHRKITITIGLLGILLISIFPIYACTILLLNLSIFATKLSNHSEIKYEFLRCCAVFASVAIGVGVYFFQTENAFSVYVPYFRVDLISYRIAMFDDYLFRFNNLYVAFISLLTVNIFIIALGHGSQGSWINKVITFSLVVLSAVTLLYLVASYESYKDLKVGLKDIDYALSFFNSKISFWIYYLCGVAVSFIVIFFLIRLFNFKLAAANPFAYIERLSGSAPIVILLLILSYSLLIYTAFNKSPLCILDVSCKSNTYDWHERHAMPIACFLLMGLIILSDRIYNLVSALQPLTIRTFERTSLILLLISTSIISSQFVSYYSENHKRNILRDHWVDRVIDQLAPLSTKTDFVQLISPTTGVLYRFRNYELSELLPNSQAVFHVSSVDSRITSDNEDYFIVPSEKDFHGLLKSKITQEMFAGRDQNDSAKAKQICGSRARVTDVNPELAEFFDLRSSTKLFLTLTEAKQVAREPELVIIESTCN